MITWFLEIVSAVTSVCYKSVRYLEGLLGDLTRIQHVPRKFVDYNEVTAIQDVHYRDVRLYRNLVVDLNLHFFNLFDFLLFIFLQGNI